MLFLLFRLSSKTFGSFVVLDVSIEFENDSILPAFIGHSCRNGTNAVNHIEIGREFFPKSLKSDNFGKNSNLFQNNFISLQKISSLWINS